MNISELIAALEKAKAEHGDVDVTIGAGYDPWEEEPTIELPFHKSGRHCVDGEERGAHIVIGL